MTPTRLANDKPGPARISRLLAIAHPLQSAQMSRAKKAVAKILEGRSDANFDFNDLCHVLERAGFARREGKGSHAIYSKDGVEEIVNIQPKGGNAKPYQVKQVRELILKYQLEIE